MKCTSCNRESRADSEFCWFCDPDIPDEEKLAARRKGGAATRKYEPVPLDQLPNLGNVEGLREYYGQIISSLWPRRDTPQCARVLIDLGGELRELIVLESLERRLSLLENADGSKKLLLEELTWQVGESHNS